MSRPRRIPAAAFKAECVALLDRVAESGESLLVTKRGRPVAKVVPARGRAAQDLRGSVVTRGDLTAPVLGRWDVDE